MIVDTHAHLWAADTPNRPWPTDAGPAHQSRPPTTAELLALMDNAGVDLAVLVPPSWEGDRNDTVLRAACAHPDRFCVMGRIPLHDPAAARLLPTWRQQPGMRGIRITLHRNPWRTWFLTGHLDWLWAAAEQNDMPLMVYAPGLLPHLSSTVASHPELRLALDHLAIPETARGTKAFAHLDDLLALAAYPNVVVKASALPCHSSTKTTPFPDLHAPLRSIVDAYGPHRVFWGSDWTRLPSPYRDALTPLSSLTYTEQRIIKGEAAADWLTAA